MVYKNEFNYGYKNLQRSIAVSDYEAQSTYDLFYDSLEWFELYVEKAGYYPNWQGKKQMPKTITRSDIDSIDSTRMKSMFSTSLTALRNLTRNKPELFLEKLQEEFYKWLDGSGIDVGNCPKELTQCLMDICEILKGKGEDFAKVRREQVRKNIENMSEEEKQAKFNEIVSAFHEPLENQEEKAKSLVGRTYRDTNNESRFGGDPNRGKVIFNQIKDNKKISGHLTNDGAVINDEFYEEIPANSIEVTQEQVDIAKQKQHELAGSNAQVWIPTGIVGGGFVALITTFGIRVFKPSLR